MEQITLPVQKKEGSGKKVAKALRRDGFVPGIIYGKGETGLPIAVSVSELKPFKRSGYSDNMIVNLQLDGEKETISSILHDYQVHPLTCQVIHLDFLKIDLSEKLISHVDVKLKGEAKGTKQGGILDQHLFEIALKGLPANMPSSVTVDITNVDAAHPTLHASDVVLPEGIEIACDPQEVVVTCDIKGGQAEEGEEEVEAKAAA